MIQDFKKRYKACCTSKNDAECNRLLSDTIIYILNKKWEFILDIIESPFTTTKERFIVLRYVDQKNGLLQLKLLSLDDVIKGCESYDSFSINEKLNYVKRLLPLIPEGG